MSPSISFAALILFLGNIGFSVYTRISAPTPESVCQKLQKAGLVKQCQEGTPWAFEGVKNVAQWQFEQTGTEVFQCYTLGQKLRVATETRSYEHIPCVFHGVIMQFASLEDMAAGVAKIERMNHVSHVDAALQNGIIRANTTLEQYAMYQFEGLRFLVMMPITEDGARVERELEQRLGESQ